jgi:hypothetical protein
MRQLYVVIRAQRIERGGTEFANFPKEIDVTG